MRSIIHRELGISNAICLAIIQCLHPEQQVTSIAKLKTNKQYPNKFRVRARMVDIRPKKPTEIIKAYCDIHRRPLVSGCSVCFVLMNNIRLERNERRCVECADMTSEPKYSYHLTLLLVDESSERLQVGLGSEEAVGSLDYNSGRF